MGAIQDIFRAHAPAYLERFCQNTPKRHRQVVEAIVHCRTETFGSVGYRCETCHKLHVVPATCGNRHCPQCQHRKSRLWLEKQLDRQLPGHHFMITFTVPQELRPVLRTNQQLGYGALFHASSHAIKTLVRDPRLVGGDRPGFFGVLHTWGRQLQFHPHIHYVVPGGALSSDDGAWHASSVSFFLPVRALSMSFRGRFRERARRCGLLDKIPAEVWEKEWNVNCQAVPSAEASIRYLAPYVFKVAISDHRIIEAKDGKVSFSFKKPHSSRLRTMSIDAMEFIRRFLQHVLPTGFMKVRYFGFLSPTAGVSLEEVKAKVELAYHFTLREALIELPPWPRNTCNSCGGNLRYLRSFRTRRAPPPHAPSAAAYCSVEARAPG